MKSLALILIYSPSCCSKPVFLSFFSRTEKKDDIFLPYSKAEKGRSFYIFTDKVEAKS